MTNRNYFSSKTFLKAVIIAVIIFAIPQSVIARGAGETEGNYDIQIQDKFDEVILAVQAGDMNAVEAEAELAKVRENFKKEYTDEDGIMDACINAVQNKEMTVEQARERITVMKQTRTNDGEGDGTQEGEEVHNRVSEETQSRVSDETRTKDSE